MTSPAAAQPRLLLVTEDPTLGAMLSTILCEEGYASTVVSSIEDALTLIGTQSFHVILSGFFRFRDVVPYQSVERLRKLAQPTPVCILAASRLSAVEVEQRGFACLITKPFDLDDLCARLVTCLQGPLDVHTSAPEQAGPA